MTPLGSAACLDRDKQQKEVKRFLPYYVRRRRCVVRTIRVLRLDLLLFVWKYLGRLHWSRKLRKFFKQNVVPNVYYVNCLKALYKRVLYVVWVHAKGDANSSIGRIVYSQWDLEAWSIVPFSVTLMEVITPWV